MPRPACVGYRPHRRELLAHDDEGDEEEAERDARENRSLLGETNAGARIDSAPAPASPTDEEQASTDSEPEFDDDAACVK